MRLIDADELLKEIIGIHDGWRRPSMPWYSIEDSIKNAPTINAIPITKCKNCTLWEPIFQHEDWGYCSGINVTPNAKRADWFCGDGIPKVEHGEWITIWREDDPDMSTQARCSICNRISERPLGEYCKWCGAKMSQEWGVDE